MNFLLANYQTHRLFFREISPTDFDVWINFFEHPETSKHWVEEKQTPKINPNIEIRRGDFAEEKTMGLVVSEQEIQ
ncbi:MAG: hypothetical protein ACKO96_46035, partial [Flammeovirgaceae bacterium]